MCEKRQVSQDERRKVKTYSLEKVVQGNGCLFSDIVGGVYNDVRLVCCGPHIGEQDIGIQAKVDLPAF